MSPDLRSAFAFEMSSARTAYAEGNLDYAFAKLERAHILGQRALWPHIATHWWMLKVAWYKADWREIRGQIARMIAAVFGYVFGWVPLGNTGGANVSPIKPMPIPAEFARFFEPTRKREKRIRFGFFAVLFVLICGSIFARGVWSRAGEGVEVVTKYDGECTKLSGYQGAEDIVIDAERRMAYAVGGDRRSFRSGGPGRAQIWAIPLDSKVPAVPIDVSPTKPAVFYSFGADLHIDANGTRRLFVANRADGGHTVDVFRVTDAGLMQHERALRSPLLKNPNEIIAIAADRALVTLDKSADAGTLWEILEGAFERLTGKVLLIGPTEARIVADGINMANGIALLPDGQTAYVAELVGRSLVVFDRNISTNELTRRLSVPLHAAPDNITVAPDGRVIIAAHPKLLTLALGYQQSEEKPSPSEVFVYNPTSNSVKTLFASDGKEIAASSVAALDPQTGKLFIGSAFGPHILQCKLANL